MSVFTMTFSTMYSAGHGQHNPIAVHRMIQPSL